MLRSMRILLINHAKLSSEALTIQCREFPRLQEFQRLAALRMYSDRKAEESFNNAASSQLRSAESQSAVIQPNTENHIKIDPLVSGMKHYNRDRVLGIMENEARHPGFTTAADVVKYSPDLQMLIALGVSLKDVEKLEGALDLLSEIKYYPTVHNILRLLSEVGVTEFGTVITKCPFVLDLEPKVLVERILYLSKKRFTREQISLIITKYPNWLLQEVDEVDSRLGAFQKIFELTGVQIREMVCHSPRAVFANMVKLQRTMFHLKEVQEFSRSQLKKIVISSPSTLTLNARTLQYRLDYLLDTMHISKDMIASWPLILKCREKILKERHEMLAHLNKAVYETSEPGYVSLQTLVSGSTEHFCKNVAKIPEEQYYDFLKTL